MSDNVNRESRSTVHMIALLIMAIFLSMGGRVIFSPLMPYLQEEIDITLTMAGTLFLFVSVSFSLGLLLAGFVSFWIGHGRTIVSALAMVSSGLLICASAHSVMMLSFGMIWIGTGAGIYPPSGFAMINNKISVEKRSSAYAFHELGPNLALLVAPFFVLAAAPVLGWRGVVVLTSGLTGIGALAFYIWGAADSGFGARPNLSIVGRILRMRDAQMAMLLFSAALGGWQGVYAILPAYLVDNNLGSAEYVNSLLTASRATSVVMLLFTGMIIARLGRRKTIVVSLLFTSVLTGMLGVVEGRLLAAVMVIQPALVSVMLPAMLSSLAGVGEEQYQNITSALIITIGMSVGTGVVPVLLGMFGDYGLGWLGFVALSVYILTAVIALILTPTFGRD